MKPTDLGSAEADRIRRVFEDRDKRGQPGKARRRAGLRLAAERGDRMRALLRRLMPEIATPAILDVGCGGGGDLRQWQLTGWPPGQLAGVDLVADRVEMARALCPGADIRVSTGVELPFDDERFDVVTAATVFSSILDPSVRQRLFREMERVVRPNGLVVLYDFVISNPRNPFVVPMRASTLVSTAGRPPDHSERLSALIYAVAAAGAVHPSLEPVAMLLAPRTHRLSAWRVG